MGTLAKLGWTGFVKLSAFTLVLMTYTFNPELRKLDYNLFRGRQPIEKNFFNNPPVLEAVCETNDEGMNETYLINTESEKKVSILYDMLPTNQEIFSGLEERASSGYSETAKYNDVSFVMNKGKLFIAYENDTLEINSNIFKTRNIRYGLMLPEKEKSISNSFTDYLDNLFN